MMKLIIAAAFATVIGMPNAAAQSLVQRNDWQDRTFETYLPRVNTTVPWLEIDPTAELPGRGAVRALLQRVDTSGVRRWGP